MEYKFARMKKKRALILLMIVASSFMVGRWYEQFIYADICLDMGGGRNPSGYPICVIVEPYDPNASSIPQGLSQNRFC